MNTGFSPKKKKGKQNFDFKEIKCAYQDPHRLKASKANEMFRKGKTR